MAWWLFGYAVTFLAIAFFARHYEYSHNIVVCTLFACCLPLIESPPLAPGLAVLRFAAA